VSLPPDCIISLRQKGVMMPLQSSGVVGYC
jgi:hypothetical protein